MNLLQGLFGFDWAFSHYFCVLVRRFNVYYLIYDGCRVRSGSGLDISLHLRDLVQLQ